MGPEEQLGIVADEIRAASGTALTEGEIGTTRHVLRTLPRIDFDPDEQLEIHRPSLDMLPTSVSFAGRTHWLSRLSEGECRLVATLAANPERWFTNDEVYPIFGVAGSTAQTYLHQFRHRVIEQQRLGHGAHPEKLEQHFEFAQSGDTRLMRMKENAAASWTGFEKAELGWLVEGLDRRTKQFEVFGRTVDVSTLAYDEQVIAQVLLSYPGLAFPVDLIERMHVRLAPESQSTVTSQSIQSISDPEAVPAAFLEILHMTTPFGGPGGRRAVWVEEPARRTLEERLRMNAAVPPLLEEELSPSDIADLVATGHEAGLRKRLLMGVGDGLAQIHMNAATAQMERRRAEQAERESRILELLMRMDAVGEVLFPPQAAVAEELATKPSARPAAQHLVQELVRLEEQSGVGDPVKTTQHKSSVKRRATPEAQIGGRIILDSAEALQEVVDERGIDPRKPMVIAAGGQLVDIRYTREGDLYGLLASLPDFALSTGLARKLSDSKTHASYLLSSMTTSSAEAVMQAYVHVESDPRYKNRGVIYVEAPPTLPNLDHLPHHKHLVTLAEDPSIPAGIVRTPELEAERARYLNNEIRVDGEFLPLKGGYNERYFFTRWAEKAGSVLKLSDLREIASAFYSYEAPDATLEDVVRRMFEHVRSRPGKGPFLDDYLHRSHERQSHAHPARYLLAAPEMVPTYLRRAELPWTLMMSEAA
jgi:hypothetical protein